MKALCELCRWRFGVEEVLTIAKFGVFKCYLCGKLGTQVSKPFTIEFVSDDVLQQVLRQHGRKVVIS